MKYSGFLLACLIPFIVSAQKNFQPGYVVTLKGDTVKGFIDYREWSFTPTSVLFKSSANNSDQKEYSLNDISFFQITGKEAYRRSIVKVSLHQAKLNNIGSRDTSWKTDTVFLKVLYTGKLSLFSYEDKIKERFFLLEEGMEQPEELVLREYIREGSMSLVSENRYRDQLKAIMYKMNVYSDDLSSRIDAVAYEVRDLRKIVQLLNSGNGKTFTPEEKSLANWFAGIGLQRDNLSFDGQHFFADGATNTSSWLPKISGGVDLFANPNVGKLFFRLEAGFQMNKSNISLVNWNKTRTYELARSTVSILPQVNYTIYNTPKLKIPAGVGFGYNFTKYSKNQYKELSPSGDEVYGQNDSFLDLKKGILILLARASVVFNNKIEASFLYLPSTSFTKYRAYSLGGTNMQFQVYYLFREKK